MMGWTLQRTIGPTAPVVELGELKLHMRVTSDNEDSLIESLESAAREAVEAELSMALLTQTWVLTLDHFPTWEIKLPRPPLASVTSVKYLDADGAEQTLATSVYTVDTASYPGRITLAYDQSWPTIQGVTRAVTITYQAGVALASGIPESIRFAIKMLAADLYEHREQQGESLLHENPVYTRLLAEHRTYERFTYA